MKVEAMQEKLYEFEVGGSQFYHHNHDDHCEHQSPYHITLLAQVNKRNNLLFYGVPNDARETPRQLLQKVSRRCRWSLR